MGFYVFDTYFAKWSGVVWVQAGTRLKAKAFEALLSKVSRVIGQRRWLASEHALLVRVAVIHALLRLAFAQAKHTQGVAAFQDANPGKNQWPMTFDASKQMHSDYPAVKDIKMQGK